LLLRLNVTRELVDDLTCVGQSNDDCGHDDDRGGNDDDRR
jgi:hypothetical protein